MWGRYLLFASPHATWRKQCTSRLTTAHHGCHTTTSRNGTFLNKSNRDCRSSTHQYPPRSNIAYLSCLYPPKQTILYLTKQNEPRLPEHSTAIPIQPKRNTTAIAELAAH